ncbi:MAG: tetratricopeptide repeat protein [Acidobacteriaceae bacterium]|nr:tetratricopeptide repeat protein [Acidobacteriaceae bacterium]MBV9294438.1 tetratricopeptide repeat protein [Acidobacteriaceae bacterium]MBV9763955.1 tetratricopeptide repeat protein [Acidobacteriaceae bacterium]
MLRDRSQHPTPALEHEAGGFYTRKEVCRLLKIDNRQLRSWERQQLIIEASEYRFSDLLALKRLAELRSQNAHPRAIKQALHGLRERLKNSQEPSGDVRVYKEGRRIRVQIGKQKMEPASGQLLFDFDEDEIKKLLQLPSSQKSSGAIADRLRKKLEADHWFERGLELEQTGAPCEQIIEAYQKAAQLDPHSSGALVNLGTVFFNGHAWADAEIHYKKALEIDPNYALAHFNLGNLYDERGDPSNALHHYHEALRIHPNYADAHYNLALLHQGSREVLDAMRHWRAYLKLDSSSTWAQIARRELAKLEAMTVVTGSRSSPKMHLVKSEKT